MLNEKTQNPRGNRIFENSKFAILDPQRMRMNICHLFYSGKHAKSLK